MNKNLVLFSYFSSIWPAPQAGFFVLTFSGSQEDRRAKRAEQNLGCILHGNRENTAREASRGKSWGSFCIKSRASGRGAPVLFSYFSWIREAAFFVLSVFCSGSQEQKRSLFTSLLPWRRRKGGHSSSSVTVAHSLCTGAGGGVILASGSDDLSEWCSRANG